MMCVMCENPKELRLQTLNTHKFKESGLDNIILRGVKSYKCEECGEEYYDYGDIDKLHGLIASLLIQKDELLLGREVKYLRKYLGYSGQYFAKFVGYDPAHLSKIENGKNNVSETYDRLIRVMVQSKLPDRSYNIQDLFIEGRLIHFKKLEFSFESNNWTVKKVA